VTQSVAVLIVSFPTRASDGLILCASAGPQRILTVFIPLACNADPGGKPGLFPRVGCQEYPTYHHPGRGLRSLCLSRPLAGPSRENQCYPGLWTPRWPARRYHGGLYIQTLQRMLSHPPPPVHGMNLRELIPALCCVYSLPLLWKLPRHQASERLLFLGVVHGDTGGGVHCRPVSLRNCD
jgi:hypothetical protein